VNNNIFTAEKAWYNDWYSDATIFNPGTVGSPTLGNVVHPGGILWFTSSQLAGHLDNPLMFTSNSPVCVPSGQNGTFQFQYVGPIEQGVSFKFYITNAGSSTVRCGSTSSIPWPAYNGVTQSSINLNSALNGCSLPAGNYDAHFELTYSSCATYVAPLARVSIVNSGQIFALTSTTACQGNPVCLQASSTGNGTTTYSWYNGNFAISGATSSTYVVSPTLTGNHNFSCLISSSNSTCSANRSNIIPVTINTLPAASITLQSTSGCSATLKANPTNSTYSWSNGSTGSTLTVSYGGSYSVAVTKNNCTSAVLYSYNTVHVDYSSQTDACGGLQNGSVTVNIYWGTSPYSISWTGPVNGSSTGLPAGYKTINNLSAGNYVLTVTDAGGCTALLNVTIQNVLAQITASSNSPVCTGSTLNLSSGGGVSYSWSGPQSFSSTLQNPSISQVSSLNAGVYTVTASVTGSCSGTATTCRFYDSILFDRFRLRYQ
jgi:hypothetical protein